jgi:hypothetical protein
LWGGRGSRRQAENGPARQSLHAAIWLAVGWIWFSCSACISIGEGRAEMPPPPLKLTWFTLTMVFCSTMVRSLVDVGHVDATKVRHGVVVGEDSAAPLAAEEADAAVAESVVNTAIEADVRSPVAGVPSIKAAPKSPVAGGPQDANTRRLHPDSGNPVVACVTVGPVAGRPVIAWRRQRRLLVNGQYRRSKANRDEDACVSLGDRQDEHGRDE